MVGVQLPGYMDLLQRNDLVCTAEPSDPPSVFLTAVFLPRDEIWRAPGDLVDSEMFPEGQTAGGKKI